MKNWLDLSFSSTPLLAATFIVASLIGSFILTGLDAVFGALLAGVALWVAAVDLDRFEIPDIGSLAIFVLGLAWTFESSGMNGNLIGGTLVRSLLAAGLLFTVRATYLMVRNVEGLGLGDVKLAGAVASWLSWSHFTLALLVAVVAALIVVGLRAVIAGERVQPSTAVPFGAFLAPAAWVAWIAQVAGS